MSPPPPGVQDSPLALAGLAALGVLAWLLCHPYQGLFHDANLYALQALARLSPESLSHDVFLSHGSQDRFTLFSPLYAAAITLLGLDHAAALLTVLSQAGLCVAALLLARTLLPLWAAAAGVVLFVALPCEYGPLRIFACMEPFLTPRMAAEALILGALAAAMKGRRLATAVLLLLAVVLHPVMALAGLATLLAALVGRIWAAGMTTRAAGLALALLLVSFGLSLLVAGRFDAEWLAIVHARSPYLFLGSWPVQDWSRALTGLLPIAAGVLVLEAPLRRACGSVLLATLAGWLVTWLGADLLQSVFITQLQPWRIEWLGAAAGALLLPWLLAELWRGGAARRSAALLLLTALIFRTQNYALPIGICALGLLARGLPKPPHARLLLWGAAALCALAVIWQLGSDLAFTDSYYFDPALPLWLRRARSAATDGALLGGLVAGLLRLARSPRRRAAVALLLGAALTMSVAIARHALNGWLVEGYSPQRVASFERWRVQVPPEAEVLWPESPLSAWALLRRPHYLSGLQSSGVVFSRAAALDLKQRAERLSPVIAPANFLRWDFIGPTLPLDGPALSSVCRLGVIQYVVTGAQLPPAPLASTAPRAGSKQALNLYRCADLR